MTARADEAADVPDPSLLEIVPWTYGFAHSWALGALLSEPRLLDLILGRAGMPGTPPWRLASDIQRERRLGSARADLAFVIEDSTGTAWNVAGETKVNDPYSPAQVAAYTREDHLPFLYLPGMTGLMWEVAIDSAALRLSGRQLVEAVSGFRFGHLLGGYLGEVA